MKSFSHQLDSPVLWWWWWCMEQLTTVAEDGLGWAGLGTH